MSDDSIYDDINLTKRKTITNGKKYDFYIYKTLKLEKQFSKCNFFLIVFEKILILRFVILIESFTLGPATEKIIFLIFYDSIKFLINVSKDLRDSNLDF